MEKKITAQELAEQELYEKITPLLKEQTELSFKRGNGVTLEKNQYIGERTAELEAEISKLKTNLKEIKQKT